MRLLVEVDVSSGEVRPCAVRFGARRVPVNAVCDRWHGRDRTWWKVATDEGLYVLVRDDTTGEWDLAAVVAEESRDDAWPAPRRGPTH